MIVSKDTVISIDDVEIPQHNNKIPTNSDIKETDPELNSNGIEKDSWVPVWILVPSLLGLGKINDIYIPHLQHLLGSLYSTGIIGGKPRASMYFIGVQGPNVFYLDPHIVQDAIRPSSSLDAKAYNTYKCTAPFSMPIREIDPSMAIGIFCPTRLDWETFKTEHRAFEETGQPLVFSLGKQS